MLAAKDVVDYRDFQRAIHEVYQAEIGEHPRVAE